MRIWAVFFFYGVLSIKVSAIPLSSAIALSLISLIIFIVSLYIIGRILSKSSTRFIDIAGTITLAKAPLLVVALVSCIPSITDGIERVTRSLIYNNGIFQSNTIDYVLMGIFIAISILAIIGVVIVSYNAFSVSCNTKGAKSILGFTIGIVTTEIICILIATQITSTNLPQTPIPVNQENYVSINYDTINNIANEVAQLFKEKKYDQITTYFDTTMSKNLSANQLSEVMQQLTAQFGEIQSIDSTPINNNANDFKIAYIPSTFEKQKMNFQFTFNSQNQIAGFFVHPQ